MLRRIVCLLVVSWVVLAGLAGAAHAQGPSVTAPPNQRAEYEALFQQSLRQPSDIELAFRFAEAASRIGDFEASIGALERILFYNPNLARVRLELGVLYFRLGSFAQARSYFTSAIDSPGTPIEVQFRVQSFLNEIDRRDKTSTFSGFAQFGYRHQTNANAGPDSTRVRVFGLEGILGDQFRRARDGSIFALGGFRHIYDFETQRGETWETTVQGYASRQFRFQQFDLTLAEITTGPRIPIAPEMMPGLNIRPYVIVNGTLLGQSPYSGTGGFGAAIQLPIPVAGTFVEVGAEQRRRTFYNLPDSVTSRGQSGTLNNVYANVNAQLTSWLKASARVFRAHNDAKDRFNGYEQTGWDASLGIEFDVPAMLGGRRWSVAPFIGQSWTHFRGVNPIVDPFVVRRDSEFRYGVGVDMPITEYAGISAQVLVSRSSSNLPNFRYRNVTTIVGPSFRF